MTTSESGQSIYHFDEFQLNAAARMLLRDGQALPLTPRVFDTLCYLVKHHGRVIGKDELMREIWPDAVVEENNLNQNISTLRRLLGETRGDNRFIVTVPGHGYRFAADVRLSTKPAHADSLPEKTIAVLPFANISADPENEYFCDGLAEELSNALAKVNGLRVAARTSAFAFKNRNTNVTEIAHALGVATILEGSVRRSLNHLRISVQLINATNGYHIWSERYDREMSDIFDVQDEITLAVVEALKMKLLGQQKELVLKRYTENTEAYHLYLKGRYFWFKSTPAEFRKSLEYFQRAVDADPDYTLGYFGIASYFGFASSWGFMAPEEGWPKMEAATIKALSLDDSLPEVHHGLAALKWVYYRDWPGADKAFKRAIELNSKIGVIHSHYSVYLTVVGRFDEAIEQGTHALELDPLSIRIRRNYGTALYHARRYDEAVKHYSETLHLEPNEAELHEQLADVYQQLRLDQECINEWQSAMRLAGDYQFAALLATTYARGGFDEAIRALAKRNLERLTERKKGGQYVAAAHFARACVRLDDRAQVFRWFDEACNERNAFSLLINTDPLYDSVRTDARFAMFSQAINL
jgi:TolB-like protein/Tfp pilus assembly protein PilF